MLSKGQLAAMWKMKGVEGKSGCRPPVCLRQER